MSIDARIEQENGDGVDCWSCGDPIVNGVDAYVNDSDGYAYHEGCY